MTLIAYESIPIRESLELLVDLSKFDFVLDPVYFKQGLSDEPRMFLRELAAQKLAAAQKHLGVYRFKIWDGFRSRGVQNRIYENFWKELAMKHPDWDSRKLTEEVGLFVTDAKNPKRIPPHTTGGTVDLTLVDENGVELEMGTAFDHFGPEAASMFFEENDSSPRVKENRRLLCESMISQGFAVDKDQWWHFDYGNQKWAFQLRKPYAIYGEASK